MIKEEHKCQHWGCRYKDTSIGCCDYFFQNGIRRPYPAESCPIWQKQRKGFKTNAEKKAELPTRTVPYSREEMKRLYDLGMTDRQIALEMGLRRSVVASWRRRRKLPCHKEKDSKKEF